MLDVRSRRQLLLWLKVASVVTIVTGLVSGVASHPVGDDLWLMLFDLLNWPFDGQPADFDAVSRPLNAVLGGVMVGWGVMMFGLLHHDIFDETIRKVMLRGLLAWFVTDSLGSFAAELPGNVILNIAFLGMFLPPLLLLRQSRA